MENILANTIGTSSTSSSGHSQLRVGINPKESRSQIPSVKKIVQTSRLVRVQQQEGQETVVKNFILAPGYKYYEKFLLSSKQEWTAMHDLIGAVSETQFENFSSFRLTGLEGSHDLVGQGLLLADTDLDKAGGHEIRLAAEWRIQKAKAQREFYLGLCNSRERIKKIIGLGNNLNENASGLRPIVFSPMEDLQLKTLNGNGVPKVSFGDLYKYHQSIRYDYKDFGYHSRFSLIKRSRTQFVEEGMYTKLGKYFRSVFCLAPMPDASGSIDAISTAAMCNMLAVIPRNSIFKDSEVQVEFAREVLNYLDSFKIPEELLDMGDDVRKIWKRNVCAAVGSGKGDLARLQKLYQAGVRSFRLYSIATDTRIRERAHEMLRQVVEWNKKNDGQVEFFLGQITTMAQFEDLLGHLTPEEWEMVDGIYIGNGGGSRCKTAETGMVVDTPSISYQLRNDPSMKQKSIIVEGGVSNEPATALLLGATGLSYSAGVTGGCIESPGGALYIYYGKNGEYWKPYRGEASPSAKIIEGVVYPTGDAKQVEGANGFVRMEKKYPSMCGRIWTLDEWLAQSFVKLGVSNLSQLHALGTSLSKEEIKNVFGQKLEEISDLVEVVNSVQKGDNRPQYMVPLPLFKRTEAQRKTASAYGLLDQARGNWVLDVDYTVRIPPEK